MLFSRTVATAAALASTLLPGAFGITLPTTPQKQDYITAADVAKENMMTFYGGSQGPDIPGYMLRPDVYYWWQAGGLMGQLIHHWNITGNTSLNDVVMKGIINQMGSDKNFEPANQSKDLGNDDQLFWAFAAMDAAEYNFPAPDASTGVSWLGLAQAVFNRQVGRWDTANCGGGMRWQIFPYNNGYNYKNTVANMGLMSLSARLYRFTGNQTYGDWAEKIWDWHVTTGLVAPGNNSKTALHVYDGFGIENNCKGVNVVQFTYNFGLAIMGTSMMFNATNGNSTWNDRISGLMEGLDDHIYLVSSLGPNTDNGPPSLDKGGDIFLESADEMQNPQNSDNDDPAFKGYTLRWMAVASQMCPAIRQRVKTIFAASAQGAAAQCTGQSPTGGSGTTPPGSSSAAAGGNTWCGRRWYQTTWDTYNGYGEQMSAFSLFQNNLLVMDGSTVMPPLTSKTGGTSVSQPGAGSQGDDSLTAGQNPILTRTITTGDRAGAAIMTILALAIVAGGLFFMVTGD